MRIYCFILATLLCGNISFSQDRSVAIANVKLAAREMGTAILQQKYDLFLKTTYPEVIRRTKGGAEKIRTDLGHQLDQMKRAGNTITDIWPGDPSGITDTAGAWQCTIPQYMKIKLRDGIITTTTTLVCLSPDKGRTWYFIDAAGKSLEEMREQFPVISSRLVLPPNPQPKFEAFRKQ